MPTLFRLLTIAALACGAVFLVLTALANLVTPGQREIVTVIAPPAAPAEALRR